MSDQSENLPVAERGPVESLDVTAQELLGELEKYFDVKRRLPGDLDLNQVAQYFGIGIDAARKRMYELAAKGILVKVRVLSVESGKIMVVYRKTNL